MGDELSETERNHRDFVRPFKSFEKAESFLLDRVDWPVRNSFRKRWIERSSSN